MFLISSARAQTVAESNGAAGAGAGRGLSAVTRPTLMAGRVGTASQFFQAAGVPVTGTGTNPTAVNGGTEPQPAVSVLARGAGGAGTNRHGLVAVRQLPGRPLVASQPVPRVPASFSVVPRAKPQPQAP